MSSNAYHPIPIIDLGSEMSSHNMAIPRIIEFWRRTESLKSSVFYVEQTVASLRQQIMMYDQKDVGKLTLFAPIASYTRQRNICCIVVGVRCSRIRTLPRKLHHEQYAHDDEYCNRFPRTLANERWLKKIQA